MTRAVPVQARAKARYEAIISAAQQHFADVGRDRFNLDAVAELAGCSVGTIYRYFEDRVTLLEVAIPDLNEAEVKLAFLTQLFKSGVSEQNKLQKTYQILGVSTEHHFKG